MRHFARQNLSGVIGQIAQLDLQISTVLDVGAAHGDWSRECSSILPAAHYVLFEPLEEYAPDLALAVTQIPRAECHRVGLGSENGQREINVHPDLVGSSFFLEREDSDVNGVPRAVQVRTLDSVCAAHDYEPPYLIKIDVQGAELDVLKGAATVLRDAELIILETSFFDFYGNGVLAGDIIEFMRDEGFTLYDIFGLSYRPLDGALAQADFCFVRVGSPLRQCHAYADRDQRRAVTARLRKRSTTRTHGSAAQTAAH